LTAPRQTRNKKHGVHAKPSLKKKIARKIKKKDDL